MSNAWATSRPVGLDMTSIADGRIHTITGAEFDNGVWRGTGRYHAVCGAEVLAAAMASAPGLRCPLCSQHHRDDRPTPPSGLLARLIRLRRAL